MRALTISISSSFILLITTWSSSSLTMFRVWAPTAGLAHQCFYTYPHGVHRTLKHTHEEDMGRRLSAKCILGMFDTTISHITYTVVDSTVLSILWHQGCSGNGWKCLFTYYFAFNEPDVVPITARLVPNKDRWGLWRMHDMCAHHSVQIVLYLHV